MSRWSVTLTEWNPFHSDDFVEEALLFCPILTIKLACPRKLQTLPRETLYMNADRLPADSLEQVPVSNKMLHQTILGSSRKIVLSPII